MGIKDQAKRIAAGASVALATSGLSNCSDNGAVDPPPPPLQCNSVNMGQTLSATGVRTAPDTVAVTVRNTLGIATWQVDRVIAVSGATLVSTDLPRPRSEDPLEIVLRLDSGATTQASFTVEATMFGHAGGDDCLITRTFTVTISAAGVQITHAGADPLPLAARQRAEIVLARQAGRVVELQARTPWQGNREITWAVTHGELDSSTGPAVRWTLPAQPGIYQAELVIDYGPDGLAFDMLLLEVV